MTIAQQAIEVIATDAIVKYEGLIDAFFVDISKGGGLVADQAAVLKLEANIAAEFPDWANGTIADLSALLQAKFDQRVKAIQASLAPAAATQPSTAAPDASAAPQAVTMPPVVAAPVAAAPSLLAKAVAAITAS